MTDRIYSAVRACLEWAGGVDPRPVLDPDTLLFLLTAHLEAGAPDPGDWSTADVHDIARTVRHWDRTPVGLRDTWLTWCDFLVEKGDLLSAESPRRLRRAIASVDLSPGGSSGARDPADGADAAQDVLPLLDRFGVGEGGSSGPPRPVVPGRPEELDAAARLCRPLSDAVRLTAWVGGGRDLRSDGDDDLTRSDTAGAAAALGRTPAEVRSLFAVARHCGLLRTTYTRVLPGRAARALAEEVPGALADAWSDALLTMVGGPGMTAFLLLADLFSHGEPRTPAQLAGVLVPGAAPGGEDPGRRSARVLDTLAALGAVAPAVGGRFRVTRLGDHFTVRQLRQSGADVAVAPPLDGMDAEDVLALADGGRPVDAEGLVEGWLAARDTESAVCDLLEACDAPGDWHRRQRVADVLSALDEDLSPVLRLYVHHPVLGGWARGLRGGTDTDPLSHQAVWAVLDRYAIRLDAGRPLPESDRERYARFPEEFARAVWLTGHPVSDTVLDRICGGALGASLADAARRVRPAPAVP
ncbi:hypothetical protein OUQ99_11315 [Streptomonospora nanhaiensis]|uniref:Uncharacterized protein n=1 Tax=Streptomonospora nanhaiensis TaxID=1323731 RepID=A0ABY6YTA8_9ACTN|nr:hypothetical protein [Streptomonospora nanhaiensis]WAE75627.1 hypothetical protein OUQ99_11315 [Streptomonospora nanhaiensis]